MKTLTAILLSCSCAILSNETARAQDHDPEQIQKDLDHVFERPPGRVDRALVQQRFADFFKKYGKADLGHLSFARGLAHYWNGEIDKAIQSFDGYLLKFDPQKFIVSREQRMTIGRAYLSKAVRMSREADMDDAKTATQFVGCARNFARCYDDVQSVGHYVTRNLGEDRKKLAARARVAMCQELLKRDMPAEQLDATIRSLYVPRGAGGRAAGAARARPAKMAARRKGPTDLKPFTETAMSGREIDLKGYRGQVVLVDFWATWCGPCLREMPSVVKAYDKLHDQGFEVIGISLDKPDAEQKIQDTAKRYGMKWEQIYDGGYWNAKLAKANGIRSIPSAFLIDRTGKVRFSGKDTRGPNLLANIEKLLAEKSRVRR